MYELNLDPEVIKYTGNVAFNSIDEALQFIRDYDQYEKYGMGRWTAIRKSDNKKVKVCRVINAARAKRMSGRNE